MPASAGLDNMQILSFRSALNKMIGEVLRREIVPRKFSDLVDLPNIGGSRDDIYDSVFDR